MSFFYIISNILYPCMLGCFDYRCAKTWNKSTSDLQRKKISLLYFLVLRFNIKNTKLKNIKTILSSHSQLSSIMKLKGNLAKLFRYRQIGLIYGDLFLIAKLDHILPNVAMFGVNFDASRYEYMVFFYQVWKIIITMKDIYKLSRSLNLIS